MFARCFVICVVLFYLRWTFLFALCSFICVVPFYLRWAFFFAFCFFICVVLFCLSCSFFFALCFFVCVAFLCLRCAFLFATCFYLSCAVFFALCFFYMRCAFLFAFLFASCFPYEPLALQNLYTVSCFKSFISFVWRCVLPLKLYPDYSFYRITCITLVGLAVDFFALTHKWPEAVQAGPFDLLFIPQYPDTSFPSFACKILQFLRHLLTEHHRKTTQL